MQPHERKKVTSAEAEATGFVKINYFRDSSTATARSTVIPTMGLLLLSEEMNPGEYKKTTTDRGDGYCTLGYCKEVVEC